MFDAVDTGFDQPGQCVLAEDVRGHPNTLGMGGGDGGGQYVVRPQRRQVADRPVDPVADEFHPSIAAAGLLGQRFRELPFVVEFDGITLQVPLGSSQMPSGPDDPGKIMVIVKTAGVGGRTTVAQQ